MTISNRELIVDSFAGGGGASMGIFMATGRHPDIAINHDAEAIAMHTANHPGSVHLNENIWNCHPKKVVSRYGRGKHKVGLFWASPDCKHFSRARGSRPVDKDIRGLADSLIWWAGTVRPRMIFMENVEEFQDWGPVIPKLDKAGNVCHDKKTGKILYVPDPERKAEYFDRWINQLYILGYDFEFRTLRACDYGSPTIRKRFFMIARCDGEAITWPEESHGEGLIPFRTAAECIDWSLPCPSIFERKRPLVENTMKRIARGIKKFVMDAEEPFIVTCNHGGDVFRGQGLNEPFKTVTSARDAHGLVMPHLSQQNSKSTGSDIADPALSVTGKSKSALVAAHISRTFGQDTGREIDGPLPTTTANGGGKSALVTAFMAKHYGGVTGVPIDRPAPTQTVRGTQNQLATAFLTKFKGTCRHGQPVTDPAPTVQASGLHVAEVRAFLMKYYGTGGQDQVISDPMHTLTAKARFGLVTVAGEEYQITDIGMRMLKSHELARAQGFPDSYVLDPIYKGKPLTETARIRMIGNSVCPQVAEAIVKANTNQKQVRAVA